MLIGADIGITRSQIPGQTVSLNAIVVSGESTEGDLGAGALYVRGTSGGLRAIQDASGQWWNLKIPNEAWVGWFGAVGDGVVDDTAALQLAIDSMPPGTSDPNHFERGSTLSWGTGRYKISSELVLNRNIRMVAVGNVAIIGALGTSAHKCAFFCGSDSYVLPENSAEGYYRILIEGFNFGDITGHNYAVMSRGIRTIWIERNTFSGGGVSSVQVEGAWSTSRIVQNWFRGGSFGAIRVLDASNALLVANNHIAGYDDPIPNPDPDPGPPLPSEGLGLYIRGSMGVWVLNNDFEYNLRHIAALGTDTERCHNLIIENNWLEGPVEYAIKLDNTTHGFMGLTIKGNSSWSPSDGSTRIGVFGGVGKFEGAIIAGNVYHESAQIVLGSAPDRYEGVVMEGNKPDIYNGFAAFRAGKNYIDQTGIVSGADTKVTFGTEAFDVRSCYDAATSTWTPQRGKVRLSAGVYFSAGNVVGSLCSLSIYKNGFRLRRKYDYVVNATAFTLSIDATDECDGNDTYEVYVNAGGAGDKTISGSFEDTWFEGYTLS